MNSPSIKTFHWTNETLAKSEYDEWFATLQEACSKKAIGHCVDTQFSELYTPQPPEPPVNNTAAVLAAHRTELVAFKSKQIKYYLEYDKAAGYLRNTLVYGSKARMEIDKIISTPPPPPPQIVGQPPLPPIPWTPDLAFKAAMRHLKTNYAPQDATDGATIRLKMQILTDESEGGFASYAEQFSNLHCTLLRANQIPSEEDCLEWVMKGLRNKEIKSTLSASTLFQNGGRPTFFEVFKFVRDYLKRLGDELDPYKTTKGGANEKPMVAAPASIAKEKSRCSRCWNTGHSWDKCFAKSCRECGTTLEKDTTICPNHKAHKDPKTRWVPSGLKRKADEKNDEVTKRKKTAEDSDLVKEAKINLKASYEALRVTKKTEKKG